MVQQKPSPQSSRRGPSIYARLLQIRFQWLFLLAIFAQAILQLRSVHQMIQDETPDFPRIPRNRMDIDRHGSGAIQNSKRLSEQNEQYRIHLHSKLKDFASKTDKGPSTLKQKGQQKMVTGDSNHTVSLPHTLKSRKNVLEGNKTVDRSITTSSTGETKKESTHATVTTRNNNTGDQKGNKTIDRSITSSAGEAKKESAHAIVTTPNNRTANQMLSQIHTLKSMKNLPEGNSTNDHNTSSSGEIEKESAYVVVTTRDENGEKQKIKNGKRMKKGDRRRNKIMGRETRVIYGIMTYDSDSERKRRGMIRSTFLNYFKKYMNRTIVSDEEYNKKKDWICSLNDLDHGKLEDPKKCRFAYAFVQGGNPNGTTMLLTFNETYPLSLPAPKPKTKFEVKDHSDTIFLNIQENGKFGKTPTWFRYAIDVLERHGWMDEWDYIFKSDTDNLLYTPGFFRFMDKRLPKRKKQLVYGGLPLDYKKCGGDKHDDCKDMVGPYFMQGGCYFLSTELARFISDETSFDHYAVKVPHEDMTTGNFVYSYTGPEKIKIIKFKKTGDVVRKHPVKKDRTFEYRWGLMLRKEQYRLTNSTDPGKEDELG